MSLGIGLLHSCSSDLYVFVLCLEFGRMAQDGFSLIPFFILLVEVIQGPVLLAALPSSTALVCSCWLGWIMEDLS